ncbi:hypothetical protein [Rhodoferax sp.]|uniref:hypothetical protein n=1 Tax=Rhodoferax sp. TaxID=50421 RepID=UPI00285252AC|nr:hypothetical protein [Rhodoferax sp.]
MQEQKNNQLLWQINHLSQKVTTEKKAVHSCCFTTFIAVKFTHSNPGTPIFRNNFVFRSSSSTLQAEPKEAR